MAQYRSRSGVPSEGAAPPSGELFLLADLDFKPIYSSRAAIRVLNFPELSQATSITSIQTCLRSIFKAAHYSTTMPLSAVFLSGRRQYMGRHFLLESHRKSAQQVCLILLERRRLDPIDRCESLAGFRFSPREREIVQYLISGLTTKEMAISMNISPNTVKQYVRYAMSKVGATTRSRMIANILSA
jgi:DNA-binding CsgD family transcriptional regulator